MCYGGKFFSNALSRRLANSQSSVPIWLSDGATADLSIRVPIHASVHASFAKQTMN